LNAVIDTNVFIYSIVEDSQYHSDAKNLLFSLDTWFIPSIVFYELYWFFRDQGLTSVEIEPLILQILDSPKCKVITDNGEYIRRGLELNRKLSPSMFNDMIILAVAEKIKTLASYDKKLRSKAKKHKIKVIP